MNRRQLLQQSAAFRSLRISRRRTSRYHDAGSVRTVARTVAYVMRFTTKDRTRIGEGRGAAWIPIPAIAQPNWIVPQSKWKTNASTWRSTRPGWSARWFTRMGGQQRDSQPQDRRRVATRDRAVDSEEAAALRT